MAGEGTIYYDVDVNTSEAIDAFRNLKAQNLQVQKTFSGTDQAAKKTGANLGGMGRKAGAAGIQIQQFVGQVQGGQSALVALSQQAADLGIVLGFPLVGAVAGITAAIAGPFITSLFDAGKATEKFNDLIKETRENLVSVRLETAEGAISQIKDQISETANELERLQNIPDKIGGRAVTGLQRQRIQAERESEIAELQRQQIQNNEVLAQLEQRRADIQKKQAEEQAGPAGLETEIPEQGFFSYNVNDFFKEQNEQRIKQEQLLTKQLEAESRKRLQAKQMEVSAYQSLGSQLTNLVQVVGAEQTALGKAIFLANQALAVANIIVSTQQAAAQALVLDPTGALSARVTALGYASAGIAAGVAVGETFAGRQTGGSVDPNSAYRVNETGTEGYKFSTGGREYIQMLGGRGEVIPANEMQNMGGGVTINVNNAPGVGATANASPDGKYITIDTFRTDMAEGGPMSRAMKGAYPNLTRKTR